MKYSATGLLLSLGFSFCLTTKGNPQGISLPGHSSSKDTSRPAPSTVNGGFDVIIKKNGDLLYGLVKEVGVTQIMYQRTDIPDGPIYTVSRDEVYAISYRNQVKDIINPKDNTIVVHDTVLIHDSPVIAQTTINPAVIAPPGGPTTHSAAHTMHPFPKNLFFRGGNVRIGLGFLRGYTRVDQVSQYASSVNFPIINVGYDVRYNQQLRLGAQIAFGPHHFKGAQYDAYDSTQNNISLNETIFMLDLYGKYSFSYHTDKLQPYILAGIGVHSSHITSSYTINFINNRDNALLIKSGSNSLGIGVIARIGTEYNLNKTTRVFGDIGIGASVLNIGMSLNVD